MTNTNNNRALSGLPALPALPRLPRKAKTGVACCCGCAQPTRGGRFLPGHDARLHAWLIRVERGLVAADAVPEPHTAAVAAMLLLDPADRTAKALKAAGRTGGDVAPARKETAAEKKARKKAEKKAAAANAQQPAVETEQPAEQPAVEG